MGKVLDDRMALSKLLDGVKSESKISIDESEEKFVPVTNLKAIKKPTRKTTFCGMEVPEQIYNICAYIIDLLKTQGKYVSSMDLAIYNASVQQWVYNNLITNMISGKGQYIHTRELTTCSESLRRSLQALGLTVVDKKQGINAEDSAENNPLAKFLDNMEDEDKDEQVITKKKKRTN